MYAHVYDFYRTLVSYDPMTGVVTRKNGQYAGETVGCKDQKGYLLGYVAGKNHRMHRLIWQLHYSEEPPDQIDHINHDTSDNRISNLRASSPSLNQANTRARGASGYKGVQKVGGIWVAAVYRGKKRVWHKTFRTPEDAAKAYDIKATEVFGEHAKTNF